MKVYTYSGIGFAGLLIIGVAVPFFVNVNLELKGSDLEKKVQQTSGFSEKESQFNILKSFYDQREAEAKKLVNYGFDPLSVLSKVEAVVPDKIFAKGIELSDSTEGVKVTLDMVAATEEDIALLINRLKADSSYGEFTFSSYKSDVVEILDADGNKMGEGNSYKFGMEIILKR